MHYKVRAFIFLMLTQAWATAPCKAIVVVETTTVGGTTSTTTYSDNTPFTLVASNTIRRHRIYASPGSDSGRITFVNQGGTQNIEVILSSTGLATDTSPHQPACRNWAGIVCTRRHVQFGGAITGNLTGSVEMAEIYRLDVGGDIQSSIISGITSSDTLGPCFITANSVSDDSVIRSRGGNISLIQVVAAMNGDIACDNGLITTIFAGMDVGDANQSPQPLIVAKNGIINFTCRDLYGAVDPQLGTSIATGSMNFTLTGGMYGTVRAGVFSSLQIAGDIAGLVEMQQASPSSASYRIAGSLTSTGIIRLAPGGLAGRIFLNSIDTGSVWQSGGKVQFYVNTPSPGYLELTSPHYPATAAALGGGSVGLVPFNLHREDSFPLDSEILDITDVPTPTANPILMRHYGPVEWDSLVGSPYVIKRRRSSDGAGETDETNCFTQVLDTNKTIVLITPLTDKPIVRGFEYVIELRKVEGVNVLRCDLPSGATPPVFDYAPLTFTVCAGTEDADADALGDADNDGCVNFADITSVLANFDQGTDVCGKLGDANRDGTVNFSDITTVLLMYQLAEYCADCSTESFAGPSGGSLIEALTEMGYESIEAFISDLTSMSEEARTESIQELGRLLGDTE